VKQGTVLCFTMTETGGTPVLRLMRVR